MDTAHEIRGAWRDFSNRFFNDASERWPVDAVHVSKGVNTTKTPVAVKAMHLEPRFPKPCPRVDCLPSLGSVRRA